MKATWNGTTIAETEDTVVVENNHYFPEASLQRDYFQPSDTHSTCPWKGVASCPRAERQRTVDRQVAKRTDHFTEHECAEAAQEKSGDPEHHWATSHGISALIVNEAPKS